MGHGQGQDARLRACAASGVARGSGVSGRKAPQRRWCAPRGSFCQDEGKPGSASSSGGKTPGEAKPGAGPPSQKETGPRLRARSFAKTARVSSAIRPSCPRRRNPCRRADRHRRFAIGQPGGAVLPVDRAGEGVVLARPRSTPSARWPRRGPLRGSASVISPITTMPSAMPSQVSDLFPGAFHGLGPTRRCSRAPRCR
jgi:hypothetical protein